MRTTTELQDYYQSVSNSRIKEIASDKESLSPEAQQILELEIKKRGIIQEQIQTKITDNQVIAKKNTIFFLRVGARLIDGIILFIGFAIVAQVFFQGADIIESAKSWSVLFFFFVYYPILESQGGTLGKRFLDIQTVDTTSQENITLFTAYKRSLIQSWGLIFSVGILLFLPFLPMTYFGVIIIFVLSIIILPLLSYFDNNNQSLYDKWTNSSVIKKIIIEEE